MALFVGVPIGGSGVFSSLAAGDDDNSTAGLHPANKFVAVIALIRKNQLAVQIEGFQQALRQADIVSVPAGK